MRHIWTLVCALARESAGTAKIEYALLVFLIGMAVIGIVKAIGLSLASIYQIVLDAFVSATS